MAIRVYKPTSAGRRNASVSDFSDLTRSTPEKSLVRKNKPVKVLGSGEAAAKFDLVVDKWSESAKQKIEAAGGSLTAR